MRSGTPESLGSKIYPTLFTTSVDLWCRQWSGDKGERVLRRVDCARSMVEGWACTGIIVLMPSRAYGMAAARFATTCRKTRPARREGAMLRLETKRFAG